MIVIRRIEKLECTPTAAIHIDTAYVAGMCCIAGEDIRAPTRTALAEVDRWQAEAGTERSKVSHAKMLRAECNVIDEIREARADIEEPSRRAAGLCQAALELDVEVTVEAAL